MEKYLVASIILAAIAGCSVAPTRQELDSADYGPAPTNYQATAKEYIAGRLKDPDSAKYDFYRAPAKGFAGNPRMFGWVMCFGVNAKNSYGGYTGMQKNFMLIRHDIVGISFSSDGTNGFMDSLVSQACAGM